MAFTHNHSINILALTGDVDAAFAKAREDDGFNHSATKAQWVAFARQTIRNREATRAAYEVA